jgi:Na+/melibiose symporter-like transporter
LPYWSLLADLLEHYKEKARLDPKRSVPTIHVNLVSSVSILLQHLYKNTNEGTEGRIKILTVAHQCLETLFSDSFSLSYRPAFEQVSSAVDQVLLSLSAQIGICKEDENIIEETNALHVLSLTAQVLLKKFDSQLVMAANQKKV